MNELEQKDIIELIAVYLTGQLSDEQLDVLNAWVKADKRNKSYFDDMRELWLASPVAFPGKPFNKDAAYQLFLSRAMMKAPAKHVKERQPVYIWLIRVAAAVVVGFILGAFYTYQTNMPEGSSQIISQVDVIVPHGSRNRLILADGTRVWLNAGSRLRYATDFGQNTREVYLEGEGYFDVAHDTTKVFVVKTDKIDVKALGTSFNVKAYPGEENIETVLVEGKLSIGDVLLAPKEKLVYMRKDQKTVIEKKNAEVKPIVTTTTKQTSSQAAPSAHVIETSVDPVIYTSWKDDLWRIESETLGSFAVKLERRYDVKIRFADRGAQALSINAAIKDESLEQVLRFLQLTVPINFSIDGKTVVLKEDKYLKERYKGYYKQK